ncbi:MAG: response regulator transcription factor [Granulosicoccus sp.]
MNSQSIPGGRTKHSTSRSFTPQSTLEDKLYGLSEDELRQLHDLVCGRLSKIPSTQLFTSHSLTEELNLGQLTRREREVLTLIASGYTRPEVAKALKISRNTAATHVANIYRKLEIESIAEATMFAFRCGVLS